MSGTRSRVADIPVQAKVLAPVLLAAIGIAVVAWAGLAALSAEGHRTRAMYDEVARPLTALVSLRDMQGDSRVEVRDVLLLRSNANRSFPRLETLNATKTPSSKSSEA